MPAKLGFNVVKCSFNGMDTNNGYVQIYVLNGYLTNIYIYRVMGIYWNNPIPLAPETPPNWSQKTVEILC